jgi:hypothetical protein
MANSDIEVLMNKDIPLKLATAFDIAKRSETRNIRRMFKNVHSNEIIAEISHIANSIYSSLRPMEYTFGFQYDGTSSGSMWITYQTQVTNSSAGNMIYNSSSTTPYILTGSSWVQINVPPQSTYQSGSNGWTTTSGLTTYTIGQAGNTGYSGAAGQAGISGFSGASGYSGFNVFSCDIKDTELMKEIFCHMVDRWKKATNEVCA